MSALVRNPLTMDKRCFLLFSNVPIWRHGDNSCDGWLLTERTSLVCLRTWYEAVNFNFIIGKFCYCGFMGRLVFSLPVIVIDLKRFYLSINLMVSVRQKTIIHYRYLLFYSLGVLCYFAELCK